MFHEIDFKQLNLNMLYHQLNSMKLKSLAITSAEAGEGKTTMAYALAQYAVHDKKRVLLIDLNCAHPNLTRQFVEQPEQPDDWHLWQTQQSSVEGLQILPAPQSPQVIFELTRGDTIQQFIAHHAAAFDQVIIDCPPINLNGQHVIPAPLICGVASGTAIVLLSGHTAAAKFEQAMAKLLREGPHLVGAIMNDLHYPGLLTELIRESHRLDKYIPKLMDKLRTFLKKQPILTIEM